jgi:membrane-bound metal-dependent hydrolase YbcI (DUF457 family)
MTPLGHAAVSYLAGQWKRASLPALVAGGLLVDIDFVLLPFPFFNAVHRVVTHNVFFVALIALAGYLLAGKFRLTVALSILAGGMIHLFCDSIVDGNPTNGIGVALFWPLSKRMFSPFNLVEPDLTTSGWENVGEAVRGLRLVLALEMPFYLGAVALVVKKRRGRSSRPTGAQNDVG